MLTRNKVLVLFMEFLLLLFFAMAVQLLMHEMCDPYWLEAGGPEFDPGQQE
jgi:hypothetical protein